MLTCLRCDYGVQLNQDVGGPSLQFGTNCPQVGILGHLWFQKVGRLRLGLLCCLEVVRTVAKKSCHQITAQDSGPLSAMPRTCSRSRNTSSRAPLSPPPRWATWVSPHGNHGAAVGGGRTRCKGAVCHRLSEGRARSLYALSRSSTSTLLWMLFVASATAAVGQETPSAALLETEELKPPTSALLNHNYTLHSCRGSQFLAGSIIIQWTQRMSPGRRRVGPGRCSSSTRCCRSRPGTFRQLVTANVKIRRGPGSLLWIPCEMLLIRTPQTMEHGVTSEAARAASAQANLKATESLAVSWIRARVEHGAQGNTSFSLVEGCPVRPLWGRSARVW